MPQVTLPDGSIRPFEKPVSILDIAADIGPGLAKATLAGKVDGVLVDAAKVIDKDAKVSIITSRDPEALELLRHDAAHVMAQAVQELYPGTQVTIGPAIVIKAVLGGRANAHLGPRTLIGPCRTPLRS